MLLETTSMFFIATLHFWIDLKRLKALMAYFEKMRLLIPNGIKKEFSPSIKFSDEPIVIAAMGFIALVLYFSLSFFEKYFQDNRDVGGGVKLQNKFRDSAQTYAKKYYFYVLGSLFLGISYMMTLFFVYSHEGNNFWVSLVKYLYYPSQPGFYVIFIFALIIGIGARVTVRKKGSLESRDWSKDKPEIEVPRQGHE